MHRIRRSPLVLSGLLGGPTANFDNPVDSGPNDEEIRTKYADLESLTAKERVVLMFRADERGHLSPILHEVVTTTCAFAFGLGILGAIRDANTVFIRIMEQNKTKMFKHPREAQAMVQEQMSFYIYKGFVRWGARGLLIMGSYSLTSNLLTAFRGRLNPFDHALAGGLVGAMSQLRRGPRPMVSFGVIGSVFGLSCGSVQYLINFARGERISNRWQRRFEYNYVHNEQLNQKERENAEKEIKERTEVVDWKAEDEAELNKEPNVLHKAVQLVRKAFYYVLGDYMDNTKVPPLQRSGAPMPKRDDD